MKERILIKLSGEALMGDSGYGIDVSTINFISKEIKKLVNDKGFLDIDFLEFDELEKDALEEETDLDFTELDIDELDVEYLIDVLDILDSKDLFDTLGEFDIKGAARGFNDESQFNVFLEDGALVLYRSVSGKIRIKIAAGGNFTLDTITPSWEGIVTGNGGEDILIYINQAN